MEIKIFQLALEKLMVDVELLRTQNTDLAKEVEFLKQGLVSDGNGSLVKEEVPETALLDTKEVLSILGVCYNTLQRIVAKGLLKPIRISQRRVRYAKASILGYLRSMGQSRAISD